jgi:hypothetical protein
MWPLCGVCCCYNRAVDVVPEDGNDDFDDGLFMSCVHEIPCRKKVKENPQLILFSFPSHITEDKLLGTCQKNVKNLLTRGLLFDGVLPRNIGDVFSSNISKKIIVYAGKLMDFHLWDTSTYHIALPYDEEETEENKDERTTTEQHTFVVSDDYTENCTELFHYSKDQQDIFCRHYVNTFCAPSNIVILDHSRQNRKDTLRCVFGGLGFAVDTKWNFYYHNNAVSGHRRSLRSSMKHSNPFPMIEMNRVLVGYVSLSEWLASETHQRHTKSLHVTLIGRMIAHVVKKYGYNLQGRSLETLNLELCRRNLRVVILMDDMDALLQQSTVNTVVLVFQDLLDNYNKNLRAITLWMATGSVEALYDSEYANLRMIQKVRHILPVIHPSA